MILVGEDYICKVNDQLQNNLFCKRLQEDLTTKHVEIVNSTAKKLVVEELRTPQLHILPNIHKPVTLGKPVVSSVEFHTGKISKFVDHYLQPHAKALPLYIKDISGFINKISQTENLIKYTFLVTLNRINVTFAILLH